MNPPRKRFGQHWLRDGTILEHIAVAAELSATDCVLEIGPGQGDLTRRLLAHVAVLVAVEVDRDLCKLLRHRFGQCNNFWLLEQDILSIDWENTLENCLGQYPEFKRPHKVVANIPYNITGPILENLLGTISRPRTPAFDRIVLLLQKEVAERICAKPGGKTFGALSVRVQYLADFQWICHVPARAFEPPPQVESSVIVLSPRPLARPALDPRQLEMLVKLGFASKRKMLHNNLKHCVDREQLSTTLDALNISPKARAEDLGLSQWIALSNALVENCSKLINV